MDTSSDKHHRFCIIIGGGPSGLIQAAELLRKGILQHSDFEILERSNGYGGVWNQATYPGAACDVWSNVYQISWYRNPNWSRRYGRQQEIVDYYTGFADKFKLGNSTQFNQSVIEARWSKEQMLWTVVAEHTKTKLRTTWTANVVVSATGVFSKGKIPAIPGISEFKGQVWHTLDWPADADLKDKRVAVIGTGPSAVQVIPEIQPLVKSLTIYQRGVAYCMPRDDFEYSTFTQKLFNNIPFVHYIYCVALYYFMEFLVFRIFHHGTFLAKQIAKDSRKHLENQVKDPILREKLWPRGQGWGCKRVLVSDKYYPTLEKSNVELITDPPIRITATGILSKPTPLVTKDEMLAVEKELDSCKAVHNVKREVDLKLDTYIQDPNSRERNVDVDVLIWGTGFVIQDLGGGYKVIGQSGATLQQHWSEEVNSLYGVAVNDFPNFLILFGPNTTTLWGSVIYCFEMQAQYNCRVIRELKLRNAKGNVFAMMPGANVEKAYTQSLQLGLSKLVNAPENGCDAYYLNSKGVNTFMFPYHQFYYRWITRKIDWKNYVVLEKDEETAKFK